MECYASDTDSNMSLYVIMKHAFTSIIVICIAPGKFISYSRQHGGGLVTNPNHRVVVMFCFTWPLHEEEQAHMAYLIKGR
jgi:hypothetical protein